MHLRRTAKIWEQCLSVRDRGDYVAPGEIETPKAFATIPAGVANIVD
jgi:hypothetical protein